MDILTSGTLPFPATLLFTWAFLQTKRAHTAIRGELGHNTSPVIASDPDTNSLRHLHQFLIINPNEKKTVVCREKLVPADPHPDPSK
jgi:hypothetical protein